MNLAASHTAPPQKPGRVSYLMKEIPAVTGRGLSTAYRDAKLGRLIVRKSGRSSIVLADDLMAWLGAEPSNS